MATRAPPAIETEQLGDKARVYTGICEPFTLQIRRLGEGDVKIIWWYVAVIDEEKAMDTEVQEKEKYGVEFHSYEEVLGKLTFQMDRDMVAKAIEIVTETCGKWYAGLRHGYGLMDLLDVEDGWNT